MQVDVEIADDSASRERGLMYRQTLADKQGMLFVYPSLKRQAMWMKNMRIPLDVIFLDDDGRIVSIIQDLAPCRQQPCPLYLSRDKVLYMLEVPAGFAARYRLLPGQEVMIDYRHTRAD